MPEVDPYPTTNAESFNKQAVTSAINEDGTSALHDAPLTTVEIETTDLDPTRDDSEAETVLASPVKRREALKAIDNTKDRDKLDHTYRSESISTTANQSQLPAFECEIGSSIIHQTAAPNEHLEDSDTSGKLQNQAQNNEASSNPRKRKHGHLSMTLVDTAKRQRRSDSNEHDSDRSEVGSTQSAHWARKGENRYPEDDSHLPSSDGKSNKYNSESDSDSSLDASHRRTGRSISRTISSVARPMGRDHKRHVNKYGFTRLAEACETGELDIIKEWREKDPGQLEQPEFAGNTPLQVASLHGYPEIVTYLLAEGSNVHCANMDKDTPLIDAVENGHMEIVRILLDAGVNPSRQNTKGQQALDVLTEENNGSEIREILLKAIEEWKASGVTAPENAVHEGESIGYAGPKQGLHFMARTPENLLKLVTNNDRKGVTEFLNARVPVDNNIVAAAAKTGDIYLVNMLLAEMSPKKARMKAEKPMLAVLGTSHFDMVKSLTELDRFDPRWRSKSDGMTWYELAEERQGQHWKEEKALLLNLYNNALQNKRLGSSPAPIPQNNRKSYSASAKSTDVDGDGLRAKKRLVSRKDMRRISPTRETSSSPERMLNIVVKAENDATESKRPRNRSISSQTATESKAKRIQSSARESIALFDTAQITTTKKRNDTMRSVQRSESSQAVELKKIDDNKQNNGHDMDDQRSTSLDWSSYPSVVAHALALNKAEPIMIAQYLNRRFLPIQAVSSHDLKLSNASDPETIYMTTFQAAMLLLGPAAVSLLLNSKPVLPILTLAQPDADAISVKRKFLAALGRKTLIAIDATQDGIKSSLTSMSKEARVARFWKATHQADDDTRKFISSVPLTWVSVKALIELKTKLQTTNLLAYTHLPYLSDLRVAFDVKISGTQQKHIADIDRDSAETVAKHNERSNSGSVLNDSIREAIIGDLRPGDGSWAQFARGSFLQHEKLTVGR